MFLQKSYTKVAQIGLFSVQTILWGAFATKNHPWGELLLLGVVQRVIKTRSLNDMSLCSRGKQRIREDFWAFIAAPKGQIENSIFVNPSDTRGFTAQKSQSSDWLEFIW